MHTDMPYLCQLAKESIAEDYHDGRAAEKEGQRGLFAPGSSGSRGLDNLSAPLHDKNMICLCMGGCSDLLSVVLIGEA